MRGDFWSNKWVRSSEKPFSRNTLFQLYFIPFSLILPCYLKHIVVEFGFLCLQRPCLHLFPEVETPTCLKPKLMKSKKDYRPVFFSPRIVTLKIVLEQYQRLSSLSFSPIHLKLLRNNCNKNWVHSLFIFKSSISKNILKTSAMSIKHPRWSSILDIYLGFEYAFDEDVSSHIETNQLTDNGKNQTGIYWLY